MAVKPMLIYLAGGRGAAAESVSGAKEAAQSPPKAAGTKKSPSKSPGGSPVSVVSIGERTTHALTSGSAPVWKAAVHYHASDKLTTKELAAATIKEFKEKWAADPMSFPSACRVGGEHNGLVTCLFGGEPENNRDLSFTGK